MTRPAAPKREEKPEPPPFAAGRFPPTSAATWVTCRDDYILSAARSSLLPLEPAYQLPGFGRLRIELKGLLQLGTCAGQVVGHEVGFAEDRVGRRRIPAPDGDLERLGRFGQPAGSQVDTAEQEVDVGLVRPQ